MRRTALRSAQIGSSHSSLNRPFVRFRTIPRNGKAPPALKCTPNIDARIREAVYRKLKGRETAVSVRSRCTIVAGMNRLRAQKGGREFMERSNDASESAGTVLQYQSPCG
jgi:hypothetical protein